MTPPLTPYGLGREWMAGKGPQAGKYCETAIDGFGWNQDSREAERFIDGADAYADEVERYGSAEV